MKKYILAPLFSTLILTQIHADLRGEMKNVYVRAANSILFFTSEDIISSGSYEFSDEDETLDTKFFPLTHHFESDSDFYNFYVNGSIGYSKYKDKNLQIRGSLDEIDIKTYALKMGGGVRMNILEDADMMFGASYIYSKVNSHYKTTIRPLEPSDPIDRALDYVFNSDDDFSTYELFASLGYHPTINEYKPYINADMRYFDTKIDDPYATISDVASVVSKLKAGVVTPPVTSINGLPLKLEFYASEVFISGDMRDAMDTDNFFVAGTTFHLGTSTLVDWVSEVSFDVNIVKGDNLDGFNWGFGFSF
ncbi:MAG: Solitary outer membrane autotransporter beta-barrel domain [Campylobacterota bacterium]|nr:Solitary outer membrane autotransporter beta-barrel domain [Campylobacterota bacterium]